MMEEIRSLVREERLREADGRWLSTALMALKDEEKRELLKECCLRSADTLRFFCEHCHALPTGRDPNGETLLHLCARLGKTENACFLMDVLGISPCEADKKGTTPMDAARAQGNTELLERMEKKAGFRLDRSWRNPVRRGFHPDPSMVRVGDDFYMVNSSFVYLPALPVAHSRDLVHWEVIGHVITDLEASGLKGLPGGFGYWAPDISYDGTWFYTAATLRRNTPPLRLQMLARASKPEGPWEILSFLEVDGIDPSLFTDVDGQKYLAVNPGVRIAPVSDRGELMGPPEMIWYGSTRVKSEGPHLLYRNGMYYIFQAEGGTGKDHRISAARSAALRGPYEPSPYGPLIASGAERRIQRSGHGKAVELADGRWVLVYLCARPVEGLTLTGRETGMDELVWTGDGWPRVRNSMPSDIAGLLLPEEGSCPPEPFVCPRLNPAVFSRIRDGRIEVSGGADLSETDGAHLLVRPQTEAGMRFGVSIARNEMESGSAGIVGYYDERSFVFFGLEKADSMRLVLRVRCGEEEERTVLWEGEGTLWHLQMCGDGLNRVFLCPECGVREKIRTEFLTDEGLSGRRFTGAMAGIACMGGGKTVFCDILEEESECRLGFAEDGTVSVK